MVQESLSSQDELIALCLMMLTRDRNNKPSSTTAIATPTTTPTPTTTAKTKTGIAPLSLPFKCSVCNKEFSSYQALGGHKSSHRRPTGPLNLVRPAIVPLATSEEASSGSGGMHRCNVCYRSFATGQALGGHKRCHYIYCDTSLSSGTNDSNSGNTNSSVRNFDLNFPPPPAEFGWVEDGEEVQSPHPSKKLRQL